MPLVQSNQYQLTPDITNQLGKGVKIAQGLQVLGLRNEANQRQQEASRLSEELLQSGSQGHDSRERQNKMARAFALNPELAINIQKQLGIQKDSQRIEALDFVRRVRKLPETQQNWMIEQRIRDLASQGRNPVDTESLLQVPYSQRGDVLDATMMALVPLDTSIELSQEQRAQQKFLREQRRLDALHPYDVAGKKASAMKIAADARK